MVCALTRLSCPVAQSISSGAEHYIVHLPSLSIEEHLRLGMSDFVHRQNQQVGADGSLAAHTQGSQTPPCPAVKPFNWIESAHAD